MNDTATDRPRINTASTHRLWVYCIVTALLLAAAAAEGMRRPTPADATLFHENALAAIEAIPMTFGPWVGKDEQVAQEALRLLSANKVLSRNYTHAGTGEHVGLLIVQCRNARDMVGHYPPVCYPNSGWTLQSGQPQTLIAGDLTIDAMEYEFAISRFGSAGRLWIYNFMVLPDGRIVPDMDGVRQVESDYTQKFFGAAQVQLVFRSASADRTQRRYIAGQFIDLIRDAIETMRSGVSS
jgi:EpsI family protein